MSAESDQTEEQAIDFAQRLENMLTEVLGQPADGQYTADPQGARKKRSASYLIKTRNPQGIPLTVGGSTILRLSYRYQCSCRDSNSYLQVDESAITLRAESDPARITMRDAKKYCAIFLDDNNRKPVARLFFNTKQKYVGVFDENRDCQRMSIDDLNGIYQYSEQIRSQVRRLTANE